MNKYSVLLQYPGDGDTYFAWVEVPNPEMAVTAAQASACSDNMIEFDPEYMDLLGVFEGHIEILLRKGDI